MATDITSVFNSVYQDGPDGAPYEPPKPEIRSIVGPAIQNAVDELRAIAITSRQLKDDVVVAVFSNVNLSNGLVNGDIVNGVTLVTGDRVALLGQTAGATETKSDGRTNSPSNGVYLAVASGASTRSTDTDTGGEMSGATFYVRGGTVGKGTTWSLATAGTITLGTTPLLFVLADEQNTSKPGALDALRAKANAQATASSMNLTTATGDLVPWTGTTTVNSVTLGESLQRLVIATDPFTINVSSTLIGDNGGLPVQVRPNDLLHFTGDTGSVVRFSRLAAARDVFETLDPVTLFGNMDSVGRAGFAVLRHARGGFVLVGGQASVLSPEDRPGEKVVAWAGAVDQFGRPVIWADHNGGIHTKSGSIYPGGSSGGGSFDESEISAFDSWALAQSALVKANGNPGLQRFVPGKAHVALYGQSLSADAVGHPLRHTTALYDAMMLGNSIYSSSAASASFLPFGSNVLNTYAGTVLNSAGNALLDATQVEALDWMDGACGSDQATGFADFAKFLWLQRQSMGSDASRHFVMTSTGRGGRNIAELSKTTTFYDRTVDAASKIKALDAAAYMLALLWTQGEANVGEGTTQAAYYAAARQLFDDFDADIATAVYAQARKPVKLLHQTSSRWVTDATNQAVQMAQLQLGEDFGDVVVVGPTYHYPNKTEADGHLDANGYLWKGLDLAKVLDRVIYQGEGWQPLKVIKAVRRSNEILLMYNVPAPPLQFKDVLAGYALTNYANRGFKVTDGGGATVGISSVAIVGDATIRITLSSVPSGTPKVWYASQTTAGQGNVFDSDATPAIYNWLYLPSAGDDAAVNVASYVDKPFPLNNAACVQTIDAVVA